MKWLDPWWSTEDQTAEFHDRFSQQLKMEAGPAHELSGIDARIIARGDGDDCLFELLDGSDRVADVHLTWSDNRDKTYTYPMTSIYENIEVWSSQVMIPEHKDWSGN